MLTDQNGTVNVYDSALRIYRQNNSEFTNLTVVAILLISVEDKLASACADISHENLL